MARSTSDSVISAQTSHPPKTTARPTSPSVPGGPRPAKTKRSDKSSPPNAAKAGTSLNSRQSRAPGPIRHSVRSSLLKPRIPRKRRGDRQVDQRPVGPRPAITQRSDASSPPKAAKTGISLSSRQSRAPRPIRHSIRSSLLEPRTPRKRRRDRQLDQFCHNSTLRRIIPAESGKSWDQS